MKLDEFLAEQNFNDYYDESDAWADETGDFRDKVFDDEYVPFMEEVFGVLTDLRDNFPNEEKADVVSDRFRKAFSRLGIDTQQDADVIRMHEDDYSLISKYCNVILSGNSSFREVAEAGRDLVTTLKQHSDIEIIDDASQVPDDEIKELHRDSKEDEYSRRGVSRRDFR
jgi:hypothetical protein